MIKQSLLNTHELSILVALLVASGFFATLVYFMFGKKTDYVLFICYSLLSALALSFLLNGDTRLFILFYTSASFSLFIFFAHYFLQKTFYKRPIFLFSYLILLLIFTLLFLLKNENILLLTAWLIHEFFIILSLYLSINAIQRKVNSAKKIFLLIGLSFIFKYLFISTSFLLTSISVSIAIILFTLTYIIILDIRTQNELVKNLKIRMIQLENEMLKKLIQPHFLLNTLTILSEWIEEKPSLAVKQIELLSKEFRYIAKTSDKTVVLLSDELTICQVHLDIFNAKKGAEFMLTTKIENKHAKIPPLILHTLIENGLTHSNSFQGNFHIEQSYTKGTCLYRISTQPRHTKVKTEDGLGLTYIKARLEAAFPKNWELSSAISDDKWETKIGLPS